MLIYEVTTGSHLYGLNREGSDQDKGQVMLESKEDILGVTEAPTLVQETGEVEDRQRHWFKRFCHLCLQGNPNVLEWLFVPPSMVKYIDADFAKVIADPAPFLGLNAIMHRHLGFAKSQLHKMVVKNPQMGAARRALVDTYGYDVKYASHALRLLHQLKELATAGRITFPYPEPIRAACLKIKTGGVDLTEFKRQFQELADELEVLLPKSAMPKTPNVEEVNRRMIAFREAVWNRR